MSETFRYDEAGTLRRPGPIGRAVRLIFGMVCGYAVVLLVTRGTGMITTRDLNEPAWWPLIALGLWLFPYVVNIGFGKTWKRSHLLAALLALAAVLAILGRLTSQSFLGPPLGVFVYAWLLYTFGHLGISFLLAGVLATPGCEMRAIPHLWGLISGRPAKEHNCPGILSPIDRWEAGLRSKQHET